MLTREEIFGYTPNPKYKKSVAYFSMEFAIDQSLKIYSGGLGFLAGSHLRSAYQLKQNLLGIGMLWKYGYYDQARSRDALMEPVFVAKDYSFLRDTGLIFSVPVHDSPVFVKAYLVKPDTFATAPLFLLSTDLPENDAVSRTITHRLYDPNEATRIAQSIILGIGGAMLLDLLQQPPDLYHMNEGHAVCLNFYLYAQSRNLEEVKKKVVFTTHTPEMAGNEEHSYALLKEMSFFYHLQDHEVRSLLNMEAETFSYTLAALRFSHKANAVSKLHGQIAREMWGSYPGICEIIAITNAQNSEYWKDEVIGTAIKASNDELLVTRKKQLKRELFKIVADQCGKIFNEEVITIVWARRFAGYKRADLIMRDWSRFLQLISNPDVPVQIIWAGKPYPEDSSAINLFNHIAEQVKPYANCAVLTGYELALSAALKKGSDVWLNNPNMYREASGTSGMTAAMNASVNLSLPDGWVPEFAADQQNCFLITPAPDRSSAELIDHFENNSLMDTLENHVLPTYYHDRAKWLSIIKNAAVGVEPAFESSRMAEEYATQLYN
jgi:starch phosphorylase